MHPLDTHEQHMSNHQALLTVRLQSHVICTPTAATVIKSYSPNLMVHPLMRSSPDSPSSGPAPVSSSTSPHDTDPRRIAERIIPMLDRLHVLVIGPGLGRDPLMQDTCALVARAAREKGLPFVLDADALQLVQRDPALVRGYGLAVLTPNVVEFGRLTSALGVDEQVAKAAEQAGETAKVEALAKELGGVMVVQKGPKDHISDGKVTFTVDLEGGRKRSGGQGDTLTGSIATFLGWRKAYLDGIWETGNQLKEEELVGLAVVGGSAVTRVSCVFNVYFHLSYHLVAANRLYRNARGWPSPRRAAACRPATSRMRCTRPS
jgi:ATP-dependent NAD(P)H-hydrate dehydratase